MKRLIKHVSKNSVQAELSDILEKYKGKFINIDNDLNEVTDRESNKMVIVYSKFKIDRTYETDDQWGKIIEELSSIKDIKTIVELIGQTNLLSEMSDYSGESIGLKDLGDFYSEFESSYFIFEIEAKTYTQE